MGVDRKKGFTMPFKVLVVGAGAQGKIISTWLARWPEVAEVGLADIDLDGATRHVERLASPKVSAHGVDAADVDAVAALAQGADLVVAAITPPYLLGIMDAALAVGAPYQDLAYGPPYELFEALLAKDEDFRRAGLTALTCAGQSPGLTDLLAADSADLLDSLESIRIRMYDSVEGQAAVATWSAETLFGDFSLPPLVLRDGALTTVPPFSGEEIYTFPAPFGPRTVVQHIHEEIQLMHHFLGHTGLRNVDLKIGAPDVAAIKTLIEAGLWSDRPIEVAGVRVAPREVMRRLLPPTLTAEDVERLIASGELIDSAGVLVIEVDGFEGKAPVTHTYTITPPNLRTAHQIIPGATHESYVTGTSSAVFAKTIGLGRIPQKGLISADVLGPETRRFVLDELARVGLRVRRSVTTWLD
jgi:saccharopine dehydrogenase-like NADP-dependent oxidoreductase